MEATHLINNDVLVDILKDEIKQLGPKVAEDLAGRTCGINEFRRNYCGNKSAEWVRTKIFDRYPEVDFKNGGWVVNPRRTDEGSTTIIFLKPASKWLEKHDQEIDWNEKL